MNWFDIFILIVIIYCSIKGYKSGLIKQLASLVGLIAAAILSGQISTIIFPHIKNFAQLPDYITSPLSYIVAFAIIILFFYLIGTMLDTIIKTVKMGTLNKLAGVVLCVTKWLIAISIVLNIILKADEHQQLVTGHIQKQSITYQYIQPIAPMIIPYLKFNL